MRKRYDEPRTARIYLTMTLLYVPLTLLAAWLCHGLNAYIAIGAMWALCCAEAVSMSLIVWWRKLRGILWPCDHVSIEAPLLVSDGWLVHHAQCPLEMTAQAKVTAGPSMLLLSTCAMLTLPTKGRAPGEQAVFDFLAPMKLDQAAFLRKHPKLGVRSDGELDWQVCQDGETLRAYACGDAMTVLDRCDYYWNGQMEPITEEIRAQLQRLYAGEELPPMGFAMAEMAGGVPSRETFLGTMLMEYDLLPYASHEVNILQRHGYSVSIQGLDAVSEDRIGRLLGCDPFPDENETVLTLGCTQDAQGGNIYHVPRNMLPTQAVGYLKTLFRRVTYHPLQMCLMLTMAALCCVAGGLNATVLALVQVLLLAQFAFAPVLPRPLPDFEGKRVAIGSILAVLLLPAMCLLTSWFIREMAGLQNGAAILFLLPPMMLLGVQTARLSSTVRPMLTLIPVAVFAAGMITLACYSGCTWLSGLFALVAGILCAMALQRLLYFADRR